MMEVDTKKKVLQMSRRQIRYLASRISRRSSLRLYPDSLIHSLQYIPHFQGTFRMAVNNSFAVQNGSAQTTNCETDSFFDDTRCVHLPTA